jgi:hypothetical protein
VALLAAGQKQSTLSSLGLGTGFRKSNIDGTYEDAMFHLGASDQRSRMNHRRSDLALRCCQRSTPWWWGPLSLGRASEYLSLERFAYGSSAAEDSDALAIVEVKDQGMRRGWE